MLTEEQKEKLEPLTKHPKFGKLLIESIKGWENSKPIQKVYGVKQSCSDIWELDFEYSDKCSCLIGSALLNKKAYKGYILSIVKNFSISEDEVCQLIDGFDQDYDGTSEAFQFGKSVSAIVFGE